MSDPIQAFFQKSRTVESAIVFQIFRSLNLFILARDWSIAIFELSGDFTSTEIENAGTQHK